MVFLFNRETPTPSAKSNQAAHPPSQDVSELRLPAVVDPVATSTSPVIVPPRPGPQATSIQQKSADNGNRPPRAPSTISRHSSAPMSDRPLPKSVASVLEATAIPVPRRNRNSSQKLPQGNNAEDFSKLLLQGVNSPDDQLDSPGNTPLDFLLTSPEENAKSAARNDCDAGTEPASFRSVSTDSMPSLEHDLESQSSVPLSSPPSSQRSHSERRGRRPSHSENCVSDHPLLDNELADSPLESIGEDNTGSDTNSRKSSSATRSFPRLGSTFKSNLTASLRAIRSAAQTVSTFTTPPIHQDDFLTRSLFTFAPKLTDDRRPRPMKEPPSPALRRYLNPITVSPAEMHIYHEQPPECPETGEKCPVSIQMQTYRHSDVKGRRKGTFHFSAIDDLPYDPEMLPTARQREPRENSDFLRMVALEMNMRRSGKLRDDIPTRAKIWLPPRRNGSQRFLSFGEFPDDESDSTVPERWIGVSVECS